MKTREEVHGELLKDLEVEGYPGEEDPDFREAILMAWVSSPSL